MNLQTSIFLSLIAKFGWLGNGFFFFIALIECVPIFGGFFPGGTLISIAAFFAAQGYFNVWDIIIFATLGAIVGDYSGYTLGRFGSDWLIRKKIIKPDFLNKGEVFFKKYGPASIFWGRFLGATRAVVPFIAGSSKMKQRSFLFWNVISAIAWAIYNTALGYFAGNIIATVIKKWSHKLGLILLFIILALLLFWLIKKHGQNLKEFFKKQSTIFTEKLLTSCWFNSLGNRYPVVREFFETKITQIKIFGGTIGLVILLLLYILTLILDLI